MTEKTKFEELEDETTMRAVLIREAEAIAGARRMPPEIAKALVKATKEAEAVEKKRTMSSGTERGPKYNFAGADALMEEARTALANNGLAIILSGWIVETYDRRDWITDGSGERGDQPPFIEREVRWLERCVIAFFTLVHDGGDSWNLQPYSMPSISGPGRPVDKADASALTYATGYVMRGLLNLPRVEPGQQVDERDDSGHAPKGTARKVQLSDEEKMTALVKTVSDDLASVPDKECPTLETWIASYGPKAVRAIGMERLRPLVISAATRMDVPEDAWQAWLAKAVAAAKGK